MELLKALRILGDLGRIRILRLLQQEDLSVADLQEILGMGQSRISMQLSQLKLAELVEVRKLGQKSIYRASPPVSSHPIVSEVLRLSTAEISEAQHDDEALLIILNRRKDHLRTYFDDLAGKFGRKYVPGRSWKALADTLLRLMPPMVIADLGAGEGTLSLLLAQRAERVIAVDNSEKMVEYGQDVARHNGVANLEYRLGDLEELPIDTDSVDLVLMHQTLHHALHPRRSVIEAARILRPGGRIAVLDLVKHDFEAARDLYADVWLGFSQVELQEHLRAAGFENIAIAVVDREDEAPNFETLMATADKPKTHSG